MIGEVDRTADCDMYLIGFTYIILKRNENEPISIPLFLSFSVSCSPTIGWKVKPIRKRNQCHAPARVIMKLIHHIEIMLLSKMDGHLRLIKKTMG